MMSHATTSPNEINQLREKGGVIVDIREKDKFRREHIPGAISWPLSEIQSGNTLHTFPAQSPVIFHCQAGVRTQPNSAALAKTADGGEFVLPEGGMNA